MRPTAKDPDELLEQILEEEREAVICQFREQRDG